MDWVVGETMSNPEKKCKCGSYESEFWCGDRVYKLKSEYPDCPFCKPAPIEPTAQQKLDRDIIDALNVEPSVDEIANELLVRAFGKVCYCRDDYEIMCPACAFKPFLLNALRNERNRHG